MKKLDSEILDLLPEEELAGEIEQADGYNDGIYALLVRVDRVLNSATSAPISATPIRTPSADPTPTVAAGGSRVKLPKLTIQPFGGDLTKWTPFWESYCAAIHDNHSLTTTEKFNYLRSLLECEALDSIAGLALTEPNYDEAVTVLERRFGNKQHIIAKHIDALMSLEAVMSLNNIKALRRLYDQVELHTRSLKSLGVESGSYGGLLASVLLNKLPHDLQLLVSRRIGESEWKLDEIMSMLGGEVQAREKTTAKFWQEAG